MPSNKAIVAVALLAAVAGAAASLYFEPTIAQRLAGTEPGQRVMGAVLDARSPAPPAGVIVAERGDIVPTMSLVETTGRKIEIPDAWAGKPVLLNLWATWCAPCLKEMPELQSFSAEQGPNGVQTVGIALDDINLVVEFIATRKVDIDYPILVDAPGPADAGVRLGNPAGVLPYSVLVSADGRVLKTKIGPFESRKDIEAWIQP